MAGYVKMWTAIRSDKGFLALSCNARGAYMQLIVAAKEQRDDGTVCYRNVAAMGSDWGCDRSTSAKILRKIAENSLCTYTVNEQGVLTIEVANYKKWQELTVREVVENSKKSPRKITPLRPDQTRAEHIRQNEKKVGELDAQELVDLFNKMLAPPLDKVKILRPQSKRLKTILTRLKEHPDKKFWGHIYKIVSESDFLCGRKGGWKADFNWLLNPNRLEEIYEGKYDNNPIMTAQEENRHYKRKDT